MTGVEAFQAADGGVVLSIAEEGRELSLVVPPTGEKVYFVARGKDSRAAGVVVTIEAYAGLMRWVMTGAELPRSGLIVG